MPNCTFSNAAEECMAQACPSVRRDHNQVGTLFRSGFINRSRAISSNGRCLDRNTLQFDALQKRLHLITTSALRCSDVRRRTVIAVARGHHDGAKISDMEDDDARTDLLAKSDRILQTCQGTVREVDRNQNVTNKALLCVRARC